MRFKQKELKTVASEFKQKDNNVATRVAGGKLFVNNQLYRPPLVTPTPREVLTLSQKERDELCKIELLEGRVVSDNGNVVTASIAQANSLDAARAAYKRLLCNPYKMSASSNAAIYRHFNVVGAVTTEYCQDDNDPGSARFILQYIREKHPRLRNVAVFLTWRSMRRISWRQRCTLLQDAVDSVVEIALAREW